MTIDERMDDNGLIHDAQRLKELQALPLDRKIGISIARIIEWYQHYNGNVYVSFSGGKDSTVLLHLVRSVFPDVPAVFVNTGLEFPEIVRFVKKQENTILLRPEMNFREVLTQIGYPLISKEVAQKIKEARRIPRPTEKRQPKAARLGLLGILPATGVSYMTDEEILANRYYSRGYNHQKWLPIAEELPVLISDQCCHAMKKNPIKLFEKENQNHGYLGTLAEESNLRKNAWIQHGCNAFNAKVPVSQPLAFWTDQDILIYAKTYNLEIASCYGEIEYVEEVINKRKKTKECRYRCSLQNRTGCIFCAFGQHLPEKNKFILLSKTHPKLYDYCMRGGQWIDNPKYNADVSMLPDKFGWVNWNPKQIWAPSKDGLGFRKVFEMANELVPGYMKNY